MIGHGIWNSVKKVPVRQTNAYLYLGSSALMVGIGLFSCACFLDATDRLF